MKDFLFACNAFATLACLAGAMIHGEKALIGYLFLGAFQLILTVILTLTYAFLGKNLNLIFWYWMLVLVYFFGIQKICGHYHQDALGYLLFPSIIAVYNCYLTYINIEK